VSGEHWIVQLFRLEEGNPEGPAEAECVQGAPPGGGSSRNRSRRFLHCGGVHPALVVRNVPFHLEWSGGEWLALNPWVGEELGWSIADQGWFRWRGPDGRTMVETIHWVDGSIDLSPFADAEVGEGCMVLMSPDAAKQIVERFGAVTRVTRKYHEDGSDRERSNVRVGAVAQI
jgi:hypothetical protein